MSGGGTVSYTHLDVYKRQPIYRVTWLETFQCIDVRKAVIKKTQPCNKFSTSL